MLRRTFLRLWRRFRPEKPTGLDMLEDAMLRGRPVKGRHRFIVSRDVAIELRKATVSARPMYAGFPVVIDFLEPGLSVRIDPSVLMEEWPKTFGDYVPDA